MSNGNEQTLSEILDDFVWDIIHEDRQDNSFDEPTKKAVVKIEDYCREQARQKIERAKPVSELLSTTTNKPETVFGFDVGVRAYKRSLLREFGLEDKS